jgi:hypothetical protein
VYIDILLALFLLLFLLPIFLFLLQTLSLAVMALSVPNQVQEYLQQDLSSDASDQHQKLMKRFSPASYILQFLPLSWQMKVHQQNKTFLKLAQENPLIPVAYLVASVYVFFVS